MQKVHSPSAVTRFKYVRYAQGDEYLYDLTEDPGDTRNLIADAKYRAHRKELPAELTTWLRRTGWPRWRVSD